MDYNYLENLKSQKYDFFLIMRKQKYGVQHNSTNEFD